MDTTIKIDHRRREILKKAAYELTIHKKEVVTMTDIIKILIDKHTEAAIKKEKENTV